MYTKTVTDYISKGYAKEVTNQDSNSKTIWYLPHHPVTNVNKPGKVRVVFDCAAKYKDISLNSQLLQGPDMMNSLVGVLIQFRQEQIAVSADIEAMFHQVRVCEKDCDALRFLWWPGGDMSKTPKTYCMQVHLFGATSSPSCAAYALKKTASDNADKFGPEVISTVDRNVYVDDCLKSVPSEMEAVKLATDLQSLMRLGGFRLTKWISNSRTVLNKIPDSERAPTVVILDHWDLPSCDRALSVNWNVKDEYCKRWWRQIQYISETSWKRRVRESLPTPQTRQKWQRETRDLQVNDVVLLVEDNIPRGQWPLGRVTEIIKGRDGHVRKCKVQSRNSNFMRPITKLCLLECTEI